MAKLLSPLLSGLFCLVLTGLLQPGDAAQDAFQQFRIRLLRDFRHVIHGHPRTAVSPPVTQISPDLADPLVPIPRLRPLARDAPDVVMPIREAQPDHPPTEVALPAPDEQAPVASRQVSTGEPPLLKPSPARTDDKLATLPPEGHERGSATAANVLAAAGVKSIAHDAIEEGACIVLDPVTVISFESGAVSLTGKTILNNRMALSVANWVHADVAPAARSILDGQLTGLRVADSYSCRGRDRIAGARLSEHGFANAIDIAAFRVDKTWIEVGGKHDTSDETRFLNTVRHAGCKRFTTVLGPGEPFHDDHFHLDLGTHGKSGTYTICK